MANMPVEAFRETDEPLPDPAKIYPPGVVAISYFFGPPMSLDPRYAEITAQKRKEQDTMPITYINEHGFEVPIPELSPEEFEVQSNLAIRNFLVTLKLFLNAKSSLSL
jgi:hypothetical protein